ncbi:zinc finger, CCHC-type containing protein [Tanacetum coccineum]
MTTLTLIMVYGIQDADEVLEKRKFVDVQLTEGIAMLELNSTNLNYFVIINGGDHEAASLKHMAAKLAKLDKFKGMDFRRSQKKMICFLTSMSVVYVLSILIPDNSDDATVEQIRKRNKWENDDYVCRGLILDSMSDTLFYIYQFHDSTKELWDYLETKYTAEDASSKNFLAQKSDKPKSNNVGGTSVVNMVEHNNSTTYNDNKGKRKHQDNTKGDHSKKSKLTCCKCGKTGHLKRVFKGVKVGNKANGSGTNGSGLLGSTNPLKAFMSTSKLNNSAIWHAILGHVHFKRMHNMLKDGLISAFDMDTEKCVDCIFIGYVERYKEFRFYVIKHNEFVSINSIIESRDVYEEVPAEVVVQQPKLRKRTSKSFGPEFQLYSIEGTRDEVSDQHSYFFNVKDDPKIFDEAMKFSSKDMGEAHVLLGIRIKHKSNGISISQPHYIEKVLKKFNYFECILVSTPMDTSEKLRPNNG